MCLRFAKALVLKGLVMRKIIPFFLLFSLIFTSAAPAAPAIDAAGAASLKKQINDELQWNLDVSAIMGQGLTADGKTEVTPKSDFYEVSLPHLYMTFGEQEKRTRIDIGRITVKAVPGAEAGTWEIQDVKMPSMTVSDAQNAPEATISFGGDQHFTATWAPGRGLFPKHDVRFENIDITGVEGAANKVPTVNITAIKSLSNLNDNGDSTWSGASDFGIEGVTVNWPGSSTSVSISKLSMHKVYDHLDMRPSLKLKAEGREALKHGLPQTDDGKKAFLEKYAALESVDAQGTGSTFNASGFSWQAGEQTAGFDQLTFSKLAPDRKQEKNRLLVKAAFQGLNISFIPQPLAALVPHTLNAEITIDNLPEGQLSDAFFDLVSKARAAKTANVDPAAQKQAARKEVTQFPRIVGKAGTSISVHDTYAANDDVSATIQSQLKASPEDVLGFTGSTTIGIKGLDEFLQKAQGADSGSSDPHMLQYLVAIAAVDAKGTPAKAPDGTSLRNYAIELKKSGEITINGTVVNGAQK